MAGVLIKCQDAWQIVGEWDDDSVHVVDHDVLCVPSVVRVCIDERRGVRDACGA